MSIKIFNIRELIFGREIYDVKFVVVYMAENKIDSGAETLKITVNDGFVITGTHQFESCIVYELLKMERKRN